MYQSRRREKSVAPGEMTDLSVRHRDDRLHVFRFLFARLLSVVSVLANPQTYPVAKPAQWGAFGKGADST